MASATNKIKFSIITTTVVVVGHIPSSIIKALVSDTLRTASSIILAYIQAGAILIRNKLQM